MANLQNSGDVLNRVDDKSVQALDVHIPRALLPQLQLALDIPSQ